MDPHPPPSTSLRRKVSKCANTEASCLIIPQDEQKLHIINQWNLSFIVLSCFIPKSSSFSLLKTEYTDPNHSQKIRWGEVFHTTDCFSAFIRRVRDFRGDADMKLDHTLVGTHKNYHAMQQLSHVAALCQLLMHNPPCTRPKHPTNPWTA